MAAACTCHATSAVRPEHTNTKPGANASHLRQKRLRPSHRLQRLTRGPARVGCSGPRTASTQPVPAAETQRTCIARATRCHNLHARQSACMLVLRLHLAATARRPASDNVRACQARLVSRINTQPASNRTGAGHDGGCVLASASEKNLMSLVAVGGASSASPRPSESNAVAARLRRAGVPRSRSHGAQGASFAWWHSFCGLRRSKSAQAQLQFLEDRGVSDSRD